jgi:cytochrome c556
MSLRAALFFFLAAISLAACSPEPEDDRPGQPVKHRREAFQALLRASEPIGLMLRDGLYSPERLAGLNEALARARETPWEYFGAESNYPPSKSRPEVWSEPEKFEAERKRFFDATDALLAAGSVEAAQKAYDETVANCKSCHKAFRR